MKLTVNANANANANARLALPLQCLISLTGTAEDGAHPSHPTWTRRSPCFWLLGLVWLVWLVGGPLAEVQ